TIQGQGNLFGKNVGLATSQTVNGIPTIGGTVYVRLWTYSFGAWQYNDYTYTATTIATKAEMTSPAPGSTLAGVGVTFAWTVGTTATAYWLDVGTAPGQGNIFGQNIGLATNHLVLDIPAGSVPIYARLWTQFSSGWQYNDYVYTAFAGSKAAITN